MDLSTIGRPPPPDSVVAQTQEVHLWDPGTGRLMGRLPVPRLPGRQNRNLALTFSRDGRFLIAENSQGVVRFWDARTRSIVRTLFLDGVAAIGVAVSPDGTRLLTFGEGNSVTIRDVSSGREVRALRGHEGLVSAVAFSPDGRTLASASQDGTVRLWNPDFEQERLVLRDHSGGVNAIAFSPDEHGQLSFTRRDMISRFCVSCRAARWNTSSAIARKRGQVELHSQYMAFLSVRLNCPDG